MFRASCARILPLRGRGGFRFWGLGFRVWDSGVCGFRVKGGFGDQKPV